MKLLYWLIGFVLATQLGSYFFDANSYVGGIPVDYLSWRIFGSEILIVLILGLKIFTTKTRFNGKMILCIFLVALLLVGISKNPAITVRFLVTLISPLSLGYLAVLSNKKERDSLIYGLAVAGFLQLGLVLAQLIKGESVGGIFYWLGERRVGLDLSRVAKINIFDELWLRPYGTFSHPNSLAGFAVVSFWIILINKNKDKWLRLAGVCWGLTALVCFSKGTLLALAVAFVCRRARVKASSVLGASVIVAGLSAMVALSNWNPGEIFLSQRLVYIRASTAVIMSETLTGAGAGNFIHEAFAKSYEYARSYDYQPVHNIWLLILSETGIILGGGVIYLAWKFSKRATKYGPVLILILVTGMFDHYWLTILQNKLLLGLVLGLIVNHGMMKIWKKAGL